MGSDKTTPSVTEEKKKSSRAGLARGLHIASILALVLALVALIAATLSWFFNRRELDTLTWIKTPIRLYIGSGNDHDITYLDMGSIDADGGSRDYVFCVVGEPVDIYSLQLAYTTNIAFYYDIYRADYTEDGSGDITFTYTDKKTGAEKTEHFALMGGKDPVIQGKPLRALTQQEILNHQSHKLSYGDEKGQNPVDKTKVQSNAEPLYWLATENGLTVMNPENVMTNPVTQGASFCDYYVLRVHWDKGTVVNDKETDMVYLTVSR